MRIRHIILFRSQRYAPAHYVAGLSVECIIRAYRARVSKLFDERHDLYELARAARFFDLFPADRSEQLAAAFGTVVAQWVNAHRFRSEACLRAFLVERKLYAGIRGDLLRGRTRMIVNAALDLVAVGVNKWQSRQTKR